MRAVRCEMLSADHIRSRPEPQSQSRHDVGAALSLTRGVGILLYVEILQSVDILLCVVILPCVEILRSVAIFLYVEIISYHIISLRAVTQVVFFIDG